MKKFRFATLIIVLTLVFTACSTEEVALSENTNGELLKSYEIKKDINGEYYINLGVESKTKVDRMFDQSTKTNQFYLYPSEFETTSKISNSLAIDDSQINVQLIDAQSDKKSPSITIIDDNIVFGKGNSDMLKNYSMIK